MYMLLFERRYELIFQLTSFKDAADCSGGCRVLKWWLLSGEPRIDNQSYDAHEHMLFRASSPHIRGLLSGTY